MPAVGKLRSPARCSPPDRPRTGTGPAARGLGTHAVGTLTAHALPSLRVTPGSGGTNFPQALCLGEIALSPAQWEGSRDFSWPPSEGL